MLSPPFYVSILGLGSQGMEHLQACLDSSFVHVNCLCDPAVHEMELHEGFPGIHCESDWRCLPDNTDGVIIATPPETYRDLIPGLLEKGLHILLEKPPGCSTAEALDYIKMARKAGKIIQPCAQRQFHPAYRELAHRLPGLSPKVCQIVMDITHRPSGWRTRREVGALLDLGYHAVDLARMLFGDLSLVTATCLDGNGLPSLGGGDSEAILLFYAESGTWVRIRTARAVEQKREWVRLQGEGGCYTADRSGIVFSGPDGSSCPLLQCDRNWDNAMRDQLADWVESCRSFSENGRLFEKNWGALITLRLIEEAYHVHLL